jgi:hypothetical protein
MEQLHSKVGVIANLSSLEMGTSAAAKMLTEGIEHVEIDVRQNATFPLNETAEMDSRSNISNGAFAGHILRVRGYLQTRRCVVH